jgi:hypothetical protein
MTPQSPAATVQSSSTIFASKLSAGARPDYPLGAVAGARCKHIREKQNVLLARWRLGKASSHIIKP